MNSQGVPLYFVSCYDICLLILMCCCWTINTSFMFLLLQFCFCARAAVFWMRVGGSLAAGGRKDKGSWCCKCHLYHPHNIDSQSFRCTSIMELLSNVGANTFDCRLVFACIFLRKRWKERSCFYPMGAILTLFLHKGQVVIQQMSQLRSWGTCINKKDVISETVPGMWSGWAAWSHTGEL